VSAALVVKGLCAVGQKQILSNLRWLVCGVLSLFAFAKDSKFGLSKIVCLFIFCTVV